MDFQIGAGAVGTVVRVPVDGRPTDRGRAGNAAEPHPLWFDPTFIDHRPNEGKRHLGRTSPRPNRRVLDRRPEKFERTAGPETTGGVISGNR